MDVAILRCGLDLVARPEPRRILLVITDGDPDDGSTATRALGLARDAGIEVYGIGIAIDVSPLFGEEHSMAIASVTDLATAMFHMLSRPLARIA